MASDARRRHVLVEVGLTVEYPHAMDAEVLKLYAACLAAYSRSTKERWMEFTASAAPETRLQALPTCSRVSV